MFFSAPVTGLTGRWWRRITAPIRTAAPAVALVRRVIQRRMWSERTITIAGHSPHVKMESSRGDVQHPSEGAGPLNHRRYRVKITDAKVGPEDLIAAFRADPNNFSPTAFATFDPPPGPEGMMVGDEPTVRLPGPWDGPVKVVDVGPKQVRFETLQGHMEAGWISFTSRDDDQHVVFEIESVARSGDELFDALYHPAKVAKLVQTEMWASVLDSAVTHSGGRADGPIVIETVVYQDAQP